MGYGTLFWGLERNLILPKHSEIADSPIDGLPGLVEALGNVHIKTPAKLADIALKVDYLRVQGDHIQHGIILTSMDCEKVTGVSHQGDFEKYTRQLPQIGMPLQEAIPAFMDVAKLYLLRFP